jgi:hypothetical protein
MAVVASAEAGATLLGEREQAVMQNITSRLTHARFMPGLYRTAFELNETLL